jgi:hypothetical protein
VKFTNCVFGGCQLRPRRSGRARGGAICDNVRIAIGNREASELMESDVEQRAQKVIERLQEQGHHAEAAQFAHHLTARDVERGFLFALRETCETVLTVLEAIDPVTQTMIEELRVDVEKWLSLPGERKAPG